MHPGAPVITQPLTWVHFVNHPKDMYAILIITKDKKRSSNNLKGNVLKGIGSIIVDITLKRASNTYPLIDILLKYLKSNNKHNLSGTCTEIVYKFLLQKTEKWPDWNHHYTSLWSDTKHRTSSPPIEWEIILTFFCPEALYAVSNFLFSPSMTSPVLHNVFTNKVESYFYIWCYEFIT